MSKLFTSISTVGCNSWLLRTWWEITDWGGVRLNLKITISRWISHQGTSTGCTLAVRASYLRKDQKRRLNLIFQMVRSTKDPWPNINRPLSEVGRANIRRNIKTTIPTIRDTLDPLKRAFLKEEREVFIWRSASGRDITDYWWWSIRLNTERRNARSLFKETLGKARLMGLANCQFRPSLRTRAR